jgi:hypothetical protein
MKRGLVELKRGFIGTKRGLVERLVDRKVMNCCQEAFLSFIATGNQLFAMGILR